MAAAALSLLVSGCATYTWHRPDTPPDVAAREHAECVALARDAAYDVAFSALPRFYGPARPWPYAGGGMWGDPYWSPTGDPLWRMDVEQRILERCMRTRGYDLHREPKT